MEVPPLLEELPPRPFIDFFEEEAINDKQGTEEEEKEKEKEEEEFGPFLFSQTYLLLLGNMGNG